MFILISDLVASLVAQLVKNLPVMQETLVRSLGWEGPQEKGRYPVQCSGLENSMGSKESDTTERVLFSVSLTY